MPNDITSSILAPQVTNCSNFQFSSASIAKIVVGALACLTVVGIPLGIGLISHAVYRSYRDAQNQLAKNTELQRPLLDHKIEDVPDPRNLGLCHFNQSDDDLSSIDDR